MNFINLFLSKIYQFLIVCNYNQTKKNFKINFKNSSSFLGKNSRFFFKNPDRIKLGNNLFIGENVLINVSRGGSVTIGDNTSLAEGVKIFTWYNESLPPIPDNIIIKDIVIGKKCRIGYNAIIMPGVTIGDSCKISPLSVVYTDVPSNGVAMGNPAEIIK
jgi:acetyltransferase-like isoleucine patch superfamily enzyme